MPPVPKMAVIRDKRYREHVASQPCLSCGAEETVVAAHIGHSSIGMKDSDDATIPLCFSCHNELDGRDIKRSEGGKEKWLVKHILRPELERVYRAWKAKEHE